MSRRSASALLKRIIKTKLKERGMRQGELAKWLGRDRSWISKIFTNDHRGIPLKHLDRIAAFFGLETYELFQPPEQAGGASLADEAAILAKYRRMSAEERRKWAHAGDVLLLSQPAAARTTRSENPLAEGGQRDGAFRRVRRPK